MNDFWRNSDVDEYFITFTTNQNKRKEHDICMHVIYYFVIWMIILTVCHFERYTQS